MSVIRGLARVHPQHAPAEVEETLGFVGEELRGDFVEAVARGDQAAGLAQDGHLLGNDVG